MVYEQCSGYFLFSNFKLCLTNQLSFIKVKKLNLYDLTNLTLNEKINKLCSCLKFTGL